MILFKILGIIGLCFIFFTIWCCLVVASRSDDADERALLERTRRKHDESN